MYLLTKDEYQTLLEQNVLAPKVGRYNPLSEKQKRKVRERLENSCMVVVNTSTVAELPVEAQRKVAETMH